MFPKHGHNLFSCTVLKLVFTVNSTYAGHLRDQLYYPP